MNDYLLDTHALVWAVTEPAKLSATVKGILEDTDNEVYVSVLSFWEISLKHSLQKLNLSRHVPEDFPGYCTELGFEIMPFSAEIASTFHHLQPKHHKDPFDRLLIHHALTLGLTFISKDEHVRLYQHEGLKVVW